MNSLFLSLPFFLFFALPNENKIQQGPMTCTYSVQQDSIEIELSAPTTGWLAIGFNTENSIVGSDLKQLTIREGQVFYEDQFVQAFQTNPPDESHGGESNITIINGIEKAGSTTIKFRIPMQSEDTFDFKHCTKKDFWLILAYSQSDDFEHHSTMRKHVKTRWKTSTP